MPTLPAVELDDVQLSRLPAGSAPTRWENVERCPQWIAGPKPIFDSHLKVHYVALGSGEEVKFRVPQQGNIRVVRLDCPKHGFDRTTVFLHVSNGSGLYRPVPLVAEACGDSLLASPGEREVTIGKISIPQGTPAMKIAIFTSRPLPLKFVPGYHCPLKLTGDCVGPVYVAGKKSGHRNTSKFSHLKSGVPATCTVKGPARLRVESRFVYGEADRQSLQLYRMYISLNGTLERVLELETTAEAKRHVHVGKGRERREIAVSRQQFGYVNIPEGEHELSIDCTANVICRVESFSPASYREPCRNNLLQLVPGADDMFGGMSPNAEQAVSVWDLSTENVNHHFQFAPGAAAGQLRLAQRSARDNRYRDGGLRATMLMHAIAAGRPDKPEIRTAAYDLRVFHTFYRSLLPYDGRTPIEPWTGRFHVRNLRRPADDTIDRVIGEQIVEDVAARSSIGRFVRIDAGEDNARHYVMPETNSPSWLRVVVDKCSVSRHAPAYLWLEIDGRKMRLDIVGTQELNVGEFVPSATETALSAAALKHGSYDAGTLGGPLSRKKPPAPLIEAATCEIFLPTNAKKIRLWSHPSGGPSPQVALEYRAGRPYKLGEAAYVEMLRRTAVPASGMFEWLTTDAIPATADPYAYRELHNYWVPLTRLLHGLDRGLRNGLSNPTHQNNHNGTVDFLSADELKDIHANAQQYFAKEKWTAAVEAWSRFQFEAPSPTRVAAMLGRVAALQRMGEVVLADRELRGLCLHDPDPGVRELALQQLLEKSIDAGNWKNFERWCALAALENPSSQRLVKLATAMIHNGRFEFALQVLLLMPDSDRPATLTLLASYQAGWDRTFAAEINRLPLEQQDLWRAILELKHGKFAAAKQRLAQSGGFSPQWYQHLLAGEEILSRITQGDQGERLAAIHAWEAWQSSHPGPRIWREEGSLVASCPGSVSLRSVDRELYGQYYLAEPGSPLVMAVQGPVRLKLEMRPVHPPEVTVRSPLETPKMTLDDTVVIRTSASGSPTARTIAVIGNRVSEGLDIVSDNRRAGGDEPVYIDVPAGAQTIRIDSFAHPMAIRVFAERPAFPLPVLPTLCRETLTAVFDGVFGKACESPFDWDSPRSALNRMLIARMIPADGSTNTVNLPLIQKYGRRPTRDQFAMTGVHPELLPQRLPPTSKTQADPIAELAAAATDPASQMAEWIRKINLNPEVYMQAVAAANALVEQHPRDPRLARLRRHILNRGHWTTRSEFDSSAGVYLLPMNGWQPESSMLRVRRAMMLGDTHADIVISGHRRSVFDVDNTQPAQFEFELTRTQIGHMPAKSLQVHVQIDDTPPQVIYLPTSQSQVTTSVALDDGAHKVELWVADPMANHFVLLNIRERTEEGVATNRNLGDSKRKYWVATDDQPLSFEVEGPAWMRIDRLDGTQTASRYHFVEEGVRRIDLRPTDGQEYARFRVHAFEYDLNANPLDAYVPPRVNLPVADPILDNAGGITGLLPDGTGLRMNGDAAWGDQLSLWAMGGWDKQGHFRGVDRFALGHEDGTWRGQAGINSRRALDEGLGRAIEPDEFAEFSATHFQHDLWNDRYYETQGLFRVRDRGGPTTGLVHEGRMEVPGFWTPLPSVKLWPTTRRNRDPFHRVNPFNFRWKGYGYLQSPNTAEPGFQNNTEWSFGGSAAVSRRYDLNDCLYRVSTINAFGRALSLDDVQYEPGTVDQDIFTPFKADHRYGLGWSQRFVWTPKLDRQWWLRFSSRSNEDLQFFDPDSIGVEVGQWGQSRWLQWGWSYIAREFQADDDRLNDFLQQTLNLDLRWERWRHSGRRYEITARYRHDLTQGRDAFLINFATYLSRGRGYWDQKPSTLRFGNIRKELAIPYWLEN